MTALFALAGALIVGASDFGGGFASRSTSAFRVAGWIQAFSALFIAVAVWLVDAPDVRNADLVAGAVAGVSGTFSFVALYAAFARGQISRLAPVTAVVGAVVPTMVGVARGESLTAVRALGVVVALMAIALVTQERSDGGPSSTPASAFALAVAAGLGFSVFFLALAETQQDAGLWPLLVARCVSVPIVVVLALRLTGSLSVERRLRLILIGAGLGEAISNVFVLWSYQRGPIAVAAVLGAFYPISTVLLARLVLNERLLNIQWVGVALALVAVPLIAAP